MEAECAGADAIIVGAGAGVCCATALRRKHQILVFTRRGCSLLLIQANLFASRRIAICHRESEPKVVSRVSIYSGPEATT